MNLAGEAEIGEIVDQRLAEFFRSLKPAEFVLREPYVLQEVERLLQSGRHQEAALRRQLAHKELKYGCISLARFKVRFDHGHLIQIG
jgi:hypothetical protein